MAGVLRSSAIMLAMAMMAKAQTAIATAQRLQCFLG